MKVSASDLGKALRKHVHPLLQEAGFDDVTGRKVWRSRDGKIDHIEISSLSTYRAQTDNATTASFHVNLGISLPRYGIRFDPFHKDHIKNGPRGLRPKECQMPIRGVICPASAPPLTEGRWGWEFDSLWRVNSVEEAENAATALREQFESYALDWLNRDWDLNFILELLQSDDNRLFLVSAGNGSHLWLDAELPDSNIRNAHIDMARNAMARGSESSAST